MSSKKTTFITISIFSMLLLLALLILKDNGNEQSDDHLGHKNNRDSSKNVAQAIATDIVIKIDNSPETEGPLLTAADVKEDINRVQPGVEESLLNKSNTCTDELKQQLASLLEKIDSNGPFEPTSISTGDSQLNASYEYLSLLDDHALSNLAEQGYRDAMTVRGEKLISSNVDSERLKGRELLYRAGVLGSAYALSGLSASYYSDYLTLLKNGTENQARLAYQQFHNTKYLMNQVAHIPSEPDIEFENILKNEELLHSDSLESTNLASVDAFNQHRLAEGLPTISDSSEESKMAKLLSNRLKNCVQ